MRKNILIVDDEESIRFTLSSFLNDEGYAASTSANYDEALRQMAEKDFDLFFVDIIMEGKTGMELLRAIKKDSPDAQVVIITGAPSVGTAAEAVRFGAFDYIVKPIRQIDLLNTTRVALCHKQLQEEKDRCRANLDAIFTSVKDGIITVDTNMRIVDINAAAVNLCNLHDCEDSSAFFTSAPSSCSGACREILIDSLRRKKNFELHHIECRKNGASRQVVSISASPLLDNKRQFKGCVMVLRDETKLYHLQKDISDSRVFNRFIGISSSMNRVKDMIRALAEVQTTVLIIGESGTGKEITVDALHSISDRASKPLVKVNCGALADSLLESELFGHVQGAFTGAVCERKGRFHLASGGIIFLDEIGDITPKMQLQLLRVIETMSFEKVGSSNVEKVDVRVVAATNRDLLEKVKKGEFREDLYYRLKVVQLNLPPLRSRKEDIPLLTRYLIDRLNRRFAKNIKAVSSDVEKLFQQHSWPGNVRELENTLEYAFILCNQNIIMASHLPADFRVLKNDRELMFRKDQDNEMEAIRQALQKTGGNKVKAARLLSMSRRTIYRKMEKYNIC